VKGLSIKKEKTARKKLRRDATRIIKITKSGKRDPHRLRERALD
jgi:hypothetical protein